MTNTLYMPVRPASARMNPMAAPQSSLVRFMDAIDAPVALVCCEGRMTAMNGPARDFLIGPAGAVLRERIESLVRHVIVDRRKLEGASNHPHVIDTTHERYVMTIVPAGNDLAAQDVGAMVLLRREALRDPGAWATEDGLADRFGLTAQEARVAVMLADRRTNRDIADRLGVSVHTARHHTERVMVKLHIHSRHDVKGVIG